MKCPSCHFVCSELRDLCPKCLIDLRPHKRVVGLPVSNGQASYDTLLKKQLGKKQPKPKPEAGPEAPQQPSSGGIRSFVSTLFSRPKVETPKPVEKPAQAPPASIAQPPPPPKADFPESPRAESGFRTREVAETGTIEIPDGSFEKTSEPSTEPTFSHDSPRDEEFAPSPVASGIEPTEASEQQSNEQALPEHETQRSGPAVLDLSMESDLNSILDQVIGSDAIEFEAVKVERPQRDEIEFEIEIETGPPEIVSGVDDPHDDDGFDISESTVFELDDAEPEEVAKFDAREAIREGPPPTEAPGGVLVVQPPEEEVEILFEESEVSSEEDAPAAELPPEPSAGLEVESEPPALSEELAVVLEQWRTVPGTEVAEIDFTAHQHPHVDGTAPPATESEELPAEVAPDSDTESAQEPLTVISEAAPSGEAPRNEPEAIRIDFIEQEDFTYKLTFHESAAEPVSAPIDTVPVLPKNTEIVLLDDPTFTPDDDFDDADESTSADLPSPEISAPSYSLDDSTAAPVPVPLGDLSASSPRLDEDWIPRPSVSDLEDLLRGEEELDDYIDTDEAAENDDGEEDESDFSIVAFESTVQSPSEPEPEDAPLESSTELSFELSESAPPPFDEPATTPSNDSASMVGSPLDALPIEVTIATAIEDIPSLPTPRIFSEEEKADISGLFNELYFQLEDAQDSFVLAVPTIDSSIDHEHTTLLFDLASESLGGVKREFIEDVSFSERAAVENSALMRVLQKTEKAYDISSLTSKKLGAIKSAHAGSGGDDTAPKPIPVLGTGARIGALVADLFIAAFIAASITVLASTVHEEIPIAELGAFGLLPLESKITVAVWAARSICFSLFVLPLLSAIFLGGTPGMLITGLRIRDGNNEEPSFGQLWIRGTVAPFSLLLGGWLPILFRRRSLHERLSRTILAPR